MASCGGERGQSGLCPLWWQFGSRCFVLEQDPYVIYSLSLFLSVYRGGPDGAQNAEMRWQRTTYLYICIVINLCLSVDVCIQKLFE